MNKKTFSIVVKPSPNYLTSESEPSHQKFIWAYEISITNECDEIVQLLNRFWRITDMVGRVEEVRGIGVIGLQPLIKPRKCFTYTSFCQLMTPQGTMEGYYEMQTLEEEPFQIEIPKFILSAPSILTQFFRSKLH